MKSADAVNLPTLVQKMLRSMKYLHPFKLWSMGAVSFLPLLLLIAFFEYQSHETNWRNQQLTKKILANRQVEQQLEEAGTSFRALESHIRGYLLSPDERLQLEFSRETKNLDQVLDSLRGARLGAMDFQSDFRALEKIADEKLSLMQKRFSEPESPPQTLALIIQSNELTERFFTIADRMKSRLENEIETALTENARWSSQATFLGIIVTASALILSGVALFFWLRQSAVQKKMQTEIEELYHQAPVGYHSIASDALILAMNKTQLDWLGYAAEEVIGKMKYTDLLDPAEWEEKLKTLPRYLEDGQVKNMEYRLRKKSGEWLPVLLSSKAVLDKNGNLIQSLATVSDISERKRLIEDLYENAPVGYHSLNPEGIFIAINQTELDWLGYLSEEVIDKLHFAELLEEDKAAFFRSDFPRLFEPGKPLEFRTRYRKKNGDWLPVLATTLGVFDEQGKFLRTRTTVFDITERQKLEEQIANARAAERMAQLKEQFMANMSHEIRTPLSAIMGFSHLLARTPLAENQQRHLQAIETSSEALLTLVDDLLDFSKIEAGVLRIEAIPFSLPELLHSLEEMFRQRAEKKNLALAFDLDEKAPHLLVGDPVRLTQILANLIGNALKFTEIGSIQVSVKILEETSEGYQVQFSVADTGIGIPAEKQEEIFERFRQASNETTRRYGGSGLGLSIVKRLVELQDGTIRVESELKKGSVFIVTLPYAKPTEAPVEFARASDKPFLSELVKPNLRILVAEDNPMNQRLIREIFKEWGLDFTIVQTGVEAVEAVRNEPFDLVMMDIQMPEMDGYHAAQIIRHELHSQVPILAMTAHAFPGEREKCLGFGMNDYLSKPFRVDELQRRISGLVSQFRLETPPPAPYSMPEKLLQISYLHEVSGGKKEFLKEMGEIFLRQLPRELATLNQATVERNWEEVSRTAHGMKSTLGFMGLPESAILLAEKIELAAKEQVPAEHIQKQLASLRQLCEQAMEEVKKTLLS